MDYSKKNVITIAFFALIVLFFAACRTSGDNADAGNFLDGAWSNTSEDDTCSIVLDGNNWIQYDGNKPVSKGTWTGSVTPDAGVDGTITFTVTQVDTGEGWVNLPAKYKRIKSCTVKYSVDSGGNQLTLSEKKLAGADPAGLWNKLEGIYIKVGSNSNAAGFRNTASRGAASQTAKQLSTTTDADSPPISYIITGSGTSFTATESGVIIGTAKQAITDVINAIRTDANGANVAIQFGNGADVLNIGAASVSFDTGGGTWGSIVLSGKITSSASPAIGVYSVFITSIADISTAFAPASGSGFAIDNSGTLIINGGIVSTNAANTYGIRNRGGTLIINNGSISPRGEGIYNDSGSDTGGNVIINGGTVQSVSSRAIYNRSGCTVTITGGTVTSSSSETIYNPGGTLKIGGGTVSGGNSGHAIWNTDSGTVTITGGTVSMTSANGNYAAISNDSGCTVTITGGTVLAPGGGKAISNASDGTATVTSPPAVIIGGMFRTPPLRLD
jgi:hypothetical protein